MRRICVFCGSKSGVRPAYADAARSLGSAIAQRGLELIYGGGSLGLMGQLADAALAAGGRVTGVLPRGLFSREVPHRGLSELIEVASMHERKSVMADLSDAFVALPGGFGTCDELFEIVTWAQIGIHTKPIALMDVDGYFAPLAAFAAQAEHEGFIAAAHTRLLTRLRGADEALEFLAAAERETTAPTGAELPQR
ncbi:TIGR00730 family Rossman fold protein [bacterium]|nr:MAG: TIGR00730 family Rossman fold protein [bacterium]